MISGKKRIIFRMSCEMYVYTSWDLRSRNGRVTYSIMVAGFESEGNTFTLAVDSVLGPLVAKMAAKFTRYIKF